MKVRNPRHEKILGLLQSLRQISVADLTERLGVSTVTVRKDLTQLEDAGLVIRSHGGARLAQHMNPIPSVSSRRGEHYEEKERICLRALELIHEGDTICIDAGSTNLQLAEKLVDLPIRVVTNSLQIINTLAESDSVALAALGGSFRQEASSFIGPMTTETLSTLQFDIAFIGATGFTEKGEFLTQNTIEGVVKRAMLSAARRRVILADSSKFQARAFSKFAQADLIHVLITDCNFPAADRLIDLGIEVVCV